MDTRYSAFFLRRCYSRDGVARLVVEQIQSAQLVAVPNLAAAQQFFATWAPLPPAGLVTRGPLRQPPGTERDDDRRLTDRRGRRVGGDW